MNEKELEVTIEGIVEDDDFKEEEETKIDQKKEYNAMCVKHGEINDYFISFNFKDGTRKLFCTMCISDLLGAKLEEVKVVEESSEKESN